MKLAKGHIISDPALNSTFRPILFRLNSPEDYNNLKSLLAGDPGIVIYDEIDSQLKELIKSLNPSLKIGPESYPELIKIHLNGRDSDDYGVWVYYPWSKKLIHVLDEEEFVELRTNRNRYKITREEQSVLSKKKIGVVGLSVGQSIALTLAMERTCGELRLADFDTVELTNLNRIRTGVYNLGVGKTIVAAREIAEIDPFIEVKVFAEGLMQENIDSFFTAGGKIDLLVEVCDGLDIKVVSRFKARDLQIPVVMDTNDRGMVDVERFDIEHQRPILHGLAEGLDPENIKNLSNEEKIPYILRMVGAEQISTRLKASMIEIEQSINTWPQLASSVVLGGAVTTDVCRRILLGQYKSSGRYYIDVEALISDATSVGSSQAPEQYFAPKKLSDEEFLAIAKQNCPTGQVGEELTEKQIHSIVNAAGLAPSGGNSQPWKFVYYNTFLFVFHDLNASYSFLDFDSLGAYLALGAAIENIKIKSEELNLEALVDYSEANPLVAIIAFKTSKAKVYSEKLGKGIESRITNRNIAARQIIDPLEYIELRNSISAYHDARLDILDDYNLMTQLGDILATTEKLVLMHPRGHFDAFQKELRWSEEENKKKRDGLDVATLGINKGEISALKIATDAEAISFVREVIKGGNAFKKMALNAVSASSALGVLSMAECDRRSFLTGGRAVERLWIEANLRDISFQPITQFVFLLARLARGNGAELSDSYKKELYQLESRFFEILPCLENRHPIFIFRLCKAEAPRVKALRKPLNEVFNYYGKRMTEVL
jgi:hypothetical protein